MKTVILDGFRDSDAGRDTIPGIIINVLNQNDGQTEVEHLVLRDMKIGPCIGCFKCWLKHPGVCWQEDQGVEVCEKVINSDLVVLLSPIVYGGLSSETKKGLERILPLLLPFFKIIDGEIHHVERYRTRPRYATIGVQDEPNDETAKIFRRLIERIAINVHEKNPGTGVICLTDGVEKQTEDVLSVLKTVGGVS